jgi:HAD superfamily hydrolase (TIGR01490 family)
MPGPRLVFFDLDRTVLAVNSASAWIRREVRAGHLSRRSAAHGALWLGAYHLGYSRVDRMVHAAVSTLAGTPEALLEARTRAFWDDEVRPRIRPGAWQAVARHREAGEHLVLLTGSSPYLSALAVEALGLDAYLCTRFEVADGHFTGRALAPVAVGHGKVELARGYAAGRGASLADATFYTDSYSDLPALLAVGEPVAVHPDPRLRREARRRGWRVEEWGGA